MQHCLFERISALKIASLILILFGSAFSISACGIGIGVYLSLLFLEIFAQKLKLRSFPEWKFFVPLLLTLVVSIVVSAWMPLSIRGFWKFLEGFIILYAAQDVIRERHNLRLFMIAFATIYFLAILSALCQKYFGHDLVYFRQGILHHEENQIYRLTGSLKHPNDFSSVLIPGFMLCFWLFYERLAQKDYRQVCGFFFSLCLIGYVVLATLSRSALAAIAVALFFGLFFLPKQQRRFIFYLIFAICLFGILFTDAGRRFGDITGLTSVSSSPERFFLFQAACELIQMKPFFGHGLNTYTPVFAQYFPPDPKYPVLMYAHNGYLQMAVEAGLIGVFLYTLYVFRVVWKSAVNFRRIQKPNYIWIGFATATAGLMFQAFFESLFQSTQIRALLWICVGLCFSTSFIPPESTQNTKPINS